MIRSLALTTAVTLLAMSAQSPLAAAQLNMDAPGKPKAYVVYAPESQIVPASKHATLELRFQVVSGYHVNSHTPKSQLLIPTVLTLQTASGVKAADLQYPQGKPYSFSFDPGDKLDVYAGDFTVKLPVVATPGEHTLDGTLRYQACDNASCYPPRTLPVKVAFTAK
jgi:DsbC/DsbD-like thiol-disulfide interchange protein